MHHFYWTVSQEIIEVLQKAPNCEMLKISQGMLGKTYIVIGDRYVDHKPIVLR